MIRILAFDFPQLIHSSVEQAELDPSEKVVGANKRQESSRKYKGLAHTLQEPQACSEGRGGGAQIRMLKALWFCGCQDGAEDCLFCGSVCPFLEFKPLPAPPQAGGLWYPVPLLHGPGAWR